MDSWKLALLRRKKKLAPAVPLQPLTVERRARIARMFERFEEGQKERRAKMLAEFRARVEARKARRGVTKAPGQGAPPKGSA